MVSSDPRGAIYYNTGCQYAAQWYVSGSIVLRVLDWSPAPHEGLHYKKKHVLRVQVLFSVQYSTIQTSERLLNHNSLCRVVLGGSGVVVSDP